MSVATRSPALVAVAHGTSSPHGQGAIAALVDAVARQRPDLVVAGGFVDVQQPDVPASLGALRAGDPAVVVPLLLSGGYHVHVDLRRDTAAVDRVTTMSAALGPDCRLIDVLERRLRATGYREGDVVVLAAAGSSDSRAVEDCHTVGFMLAVRLHTSVSVGFLSAAAPRLDDVVADARRRNPRARVVVSSYLMAPGFFFGLIGSAGADLVADPLLVAGSSPPAELVDLVLGRYDAALEDAGLS